MAPQKQNTATANGGACESTHLARRDAQQDTIASSKPQYRLISVVAKSAREEFRIGIRDYAGTPKVEIRIFERDRLGVWQATPRRITIGRGPIAAVIAALCECEQRL